MLVTTPCNEGRKGDMFWTKNTPYDGVVWEVAQSTPEANFAELPRHTGYFFGWGYTDFRDPTTYRLRVAFISDHCDQWSHYIAITIKGFHQREDSCQQQ